MLLQLSLRWSMHILVFNLLILALHLYRLIEYGLIESKGDWQTSKVRHHCGCEKGVPIGSSSSGCLDNKAKGADYWDYESKFDICWNFTNFSHIFIFCVKITGSVEPSEKGCIRLYLCWLLTGLIAYLLNLIMSSIFLHYEKYHNWQSCHSYAYLSSLVITGYK